MIKIPDDVGVVIGLLEDGYFASGKGYKILLVTFDGDGSALKYTFVDDCIVRTVT